MKFELETTEDWGKIISYIVFDVETGETILTWDDPEYDFELIDKTEGK